MSVPTLFRFTTHILKALSDGKQKHKNEIFDAVSKSIGLSEEDKSETLTSGQFRYISRILWAIVELQLAGLLEKTDTSTYQLTNAGLELIKSLPDKIDKKFLMQLPTYTQHLNKSKEGNDVSIENDFKDISPQESIEKAISTIENDIKSELLTLVKKISPAFFEKLVLDLLIKIGYGKSDARSGKVTGGSGDGGVDAVISEDKLGLDKIYVQAKRWEGTVGRPIVQAFVGSLAGLHAKKVFLLQLQISQKMQGIISKK